MIDEFIEGYNKYKGVDEFPYKCVETLMDNNEMIWKLLKYPAPDAWNQPNLTHLEKAAMIYNGDEDATPFHIFMDTGIPDVWTHETSIIKASLLDLYPDNRTYGTIAILFEIYSHYKINHLTNYRTRIDMITQQILETMNGAILGGIGRFHFDRAGYQSDRAYPGGQTPFKGRYIIMSNKTA